MITLALASGKFLWGCKAFFSSDLWGEPAAFGMSHIPAVSNHFAGHFAQHLHSTLCQRKRKWLRNQKGAYLKCGEKLKAWKTTMNEASCNKSGPFHNDELGVRNLSSSWLQTRDAHMLLHPTLLPPQKWGQNSILYLLPSIRAFRKAHPFPVKTFCGWSVLKCGWHTSLLLVQPTFLSAFSEL